MTIGEGDYYGNQGYAKETVTFTTGNKNEAIDWTNTMLGLGYEVTMYYDEETGLYVCIAYKK